MSLLIDHEATSELPPRPVEQQAIGIVSKLVIAPDDASKAEVLDQYDLLACDVLLPVRSVIQERSAPLLPPSLMRLMEGAPSTRLGRLRYRFEKRAVDIVLSIALLIITMPLMVGAALLVRLTSRGPIFYTQVRWGLDGRTFKIIKFRSMISDADQRVDEMAAFAKATAMATIDAPAFKSPHDPRVTRVGRILRRTNLDELPQLINVLAGQMSFVGPRPLVEKEVRRLSPGEATRRHSVRPGLTCLWQVVRSDETTFAERMHLDLDYVASASGTLDVAVIVMTPRAVAIGHGSY